MNVAISFLEIATVEKEDLIDYIEMCEENGWTKEGWDTLFDKLEKALMYIDE